MVVSCRFYAEIGFILSKIHVEWVEVVGTEGLQIDLK
jgi:hypothetical protein